MITSRRTLIITALLLAFVLTGGLSAQKKALSIDEYLNWRSIGSVTISDNGEWVSFGYTTRERDDTLYVRNLVTEKEFMIPSGSAPQFSDDAQWVAYTLNIPVKEAAKLRKDNKPVPRKAVLLNLENGDKILYDNVSSFAFPKGSKFLVVKKTKSDADAKHRGTDLVLRNLGTGHDNVLGNVASFSFNKPGTYLAYIIDAADTTGNGLFIFDTQTATPRPLDTERKIYEQMTWDEEGTVLAVLKGLKNKGVIERDNTLLAYTGFSAGTLAKIEFKPEDVDNFPDSMVISEKGNISWTTDLTKVFFGIKKQKKEPPKKKPDAKPVADVDIFHWNDERLQTVQQRQAARDRNFTYRAVYDLKNKKFVRLTDDTMRSIAITRNGKWGIGQNDKPYISDWKPRMADYYRVNTSNGERTLMFKAQQRTMGLSPDSKHFLYWKDAQIRDYQIESDKHVTLTEKSPVSFKDMEFDRFGERPPYGVTGWTKDGKAVILTHRYDLYLQPLNGDAATNLTGGEGDRDEIRFRYIRTDPEERFIDLSKPVLLSAYGQWTKKAGFYELTNGSLKQLLYDEKSFGRPNKAKNADKVLFTIQSFVDYPNYYVSDTKFTFPKRFTDANPQQSDYKWGHRILFDYTNNDGVRLQGTLGIPDDYVEGQKLPMLVNFYEKNSQNLHRYPTPRNASSPNFAGFVSNGYLVMQPDVHFRTRTSHTDMLECVEAAVQKVIDMGYVDPEKVCLHGHSYSGGGASFISTRSKMFAAIVAGAAPINLIGEFNILFSGSGQNNQSYDIYGQGRYGTNPYDDYELYRDQSPITHVQTMDTPLIYLHGGDDPTVEYNQGMEFYNALRFLGKPVIFLSYPGEGHGLRRLENQIDFQKRIRQFYDHYVKGTPAPKWMVEGVPFLEKKK
ncbi:alpha/beta hydrolase family protein [candidate division KSB1 bacterium]